MPWPSSTDYNEAIQNPQHCFGDPELRQGQTALNAMGIPWPRSGNNADVYKVVAPNAKPWAVKCFTREVHGLRERYQAISDHLQQADLPFMVRFQYLEEGIRIRGQWYPVVKMRWVEGHTLNELVKEYLDRPQILERLAQLWLRLGQEMRAAQIVHGDLQHDNVLLVPRRNMVKLRLRLIDYDGLMVPALAGQPSGECGHRNYQHPERLACGTVNAEVDRFAHLVIYTALRCLAVGGRALWQQYDNGDNLLFREADFQHPNRSALFRDLLDLNAPAARALVGQLLLATAQPLEQVPLLEDLLVRGQVKPLTPAQAARVTAALDGVAPPESLVLELAADPAAGGSSDGLRVRAPALLGLGGVLQRAARPVGRGLTRAARWATDRPQWSGRSLWVGGVGVLCMAVLAVVAGMLARNWHLPAGPLERTPPLPTFANQLPQIALTAPIQLQVGENVLDLPVERHGYAGPIEVRISGLPEGVICDPLHIAPGEETVRLKPFAALDAVNLEKDIELTLHAGRKVLCRHRTTLTVEKPTLAGLAYSPTGVVLLSGETATVRVVVQRQHYTGPIELQVKESPDGVFCSSALIPANQNAAALEIKANRDAPGVLGRIAISARVGGFEVWSWRMAATVYRPAGLRLLAVPDLAVQAGATRPLAVTVDRRGYTGPIDVRLRGLPPGVSCKALTMIGAEGLATLEVSAAQDAPPGASTVEVGIAVGEQQFDKQTITVSVEKSSALVPVTRENVRFSSGDGVQLWGTFYRAAKGKDAPVVLLLPSIGGQRDQDGWVRLAGKLQEHGFAVLSLDWRGHGDSRTVEEHFWQQAFNKTGMRAPAAAARDTIRREDFTPEYYPVLVNDLAAARLYLDRLNDEGKCNAAQVFIVAAHEGATLAALWLYFESCRYPVSGPKPVVLDAVPESKTIAGVVMLNLTGTLAERAMPLLEALRLPAGERRVPMTFVSGSEDGAGAALPRRILADIRPSLLSQTIIPGARQSGHALLTADLPTVASIIAYFEPLAKHRAGGWALREPDQKNFLWKIPTSATSLLAKARGDKLMQPVPLSALEIR